MSGKIVFVPDSGPSEGTQIRETLFNLFRDEAFTLGIGAPIDSQQSKAWLKFIVPQIERAYGLQVYTPMPAQLDGALSRIREFCATFHVNSDEIIEEILAVQTLEGSKH